MRHRKRGGKTDFRFPVGARSADERKLEEGTKNIVIAKEQIAEEFFVLSTGLAGEILQKLVNYGGRIAVYGDFSGYTSKPLRDFIYESNKGKDIFFVRTAEEAVDRLTR